MTPACSRGCGRPTHAGSCHLGRSTPHDGAAATFAEIGAAMGISREAAHKAFQRAMVKLRRSGAIATLAPLICDTELERKKPVSTFHAARAHVFAQRQA